MITINYRSNSDTILYTVSSPIEDPEEIQLQIFRTMKGLEKVDIVRPGYDVEYGE